MGGALGSLGRSNAARRKLQKQQRDNLNNFSWLQPYGSDSELLNLSPALLQQVQTFLDNPEIPQARKDAVMQSIAGYQSNLFHKSTGDIISENFIGSSKYLQQMNKLGTDIGALLSQTTMTDYQEGYNSAIGEVARERAAGLNPDIIGADQGGESADFDDQATNVEPPFVDASQDAFDFASKGVSIIQALFGLFSGAQSMIATGSEIDSIDLSNEKQIQDLVKSQISTTYSTKEFQDSFNLFKKENDDYLAKHGENDERAHTWKISSDEDKLSMFLARSVVKNLDLSSLSPRNRKRANAFARSIAENSDFLMKLRQGTASDLSSGKLSEIQNNTVIKAFSEGFANFYKSAMINEQKYQTMYYEYMADLMSKRLNKQVKYNKDGNFYQDGQLINFSDLQFDTESQQLLQQYSSSLSSQLVAEMQAQSNAQIQSLLKDLTDPSKKHSFFEQLAVFLVPHLVGFLNNFTSSAGKNFGSKLFNSGSSTVVNAPQSH